MKRKKAIQIFAIIVLILLSACTTMTVYTQAQSQSEQDRPVEDNIIMTSASGDTSSSRAAITDENTVNDLQSEGTILFAPLRSTNTYLINTEGEVVHTWPGTYYPGNAVYLLENGDLLHTGSLRSETFDAGGSGGIVQQINWQGDVVWEFEYAGEQGLLHHDIEPLPNGNILMIAWEYKTAEQALAAGRGPDLLKDGALWPDTVIEVDPATNRIVWEWHVWDHLVQDFDPAKPDYADPSEHPELVDINYAEMNVADWNHSNAIDYNAELDQILLSVHNFSEIWIIDHSTTTEEAAGHDGGNSGRGGDLLYRWGNPQAYGAGSADDQTLFMQHDAQWIEDGLPGAYNMLIFNNGDRKTRPYSSVEEIVPPLNADGSYTLTAGTAYGPDESLWRYQADPATVFYATNISGAQRLPDGNTLICDGPAGYFFEVTPAGETAWEYSNPFGDSALGKASAGGNESKMVFRALYYAADYAGLAGRDLSEPVEVIPEESGNNQSLMQGQQGQNRQPGNQGQSLQDAAQLPRNAIDACDGLSEGAACQVDKLNGQLEGVCRTVQGGILACVPQDGPPRQ